MDQDKLAELLKKLSTSSPEDLEKDMKVLNSMKPEERAKMEAETQKFMSSPEGQKLMGNSEVQKLRKTLQQRITNNRKGRMAQRTRKMVVRPKNDEIVEQGVLVTSSRNLKYFPIIRSQQQTSINNAIEVGHAQCIPLFQRLQNTPYSGRGVWVAYNPYGLKMNAKGKILENRRGKRLLGPKAKVGGHLAVYLENGSISIEEVIEIEGILAKQAELMLREEEVKKIQAEAREKGLGDGLLAGENVVSGTTQKEVDYGKDEDYLGEDEKEEEDEGDDVVGKVTIAEEDSEDEDSDLDEDKYSIVDNGNDGSVLVDHGSDSDEEE